MLAIKIISNSSRLKTKITPLYYQLKLLKLNKIYKLQLIKFKCNLKKQNLPTIFQQYYCSVAAVHCHKTRQASQNKYFQQRVNKKITQNSIKIKGAKIWNNLPAFLVNQKISLGKITFINAPKKFLLDQQK